MKFENELVGKGFFICVNNWFCCAVRSIIDATSEPDIALLKSFFNHEVIDINLEKTVSEYLHGYIAFVGNIHANTGNKQREWKILYSIDKELDGKLLFGSNAKDDVIVAVNNKLSVFNWTVEYGIPPVGFEFSAL